MSTIKKVADYLKNRWGINSTFQVVIILIVFACTGFSTLYAEDCIFRLLNIPDVNSWYMRLLILIFVTLPLYNIILLIYGFIFGQFKFFWNFEKRFFGRLISIFKKKQG